MTLCDLPETKLGGKKGRYSMPGQEAVVSLLSLLSISRVFEPNYLSPMLMRVSIAPQDNSG